MSNDVIKVHDLPGIAQYSESIKQFSQSLTTATQDTARTFNVKIEGSEGEAIAAFLGQLNSLQNQVFNQIPAFLNKYSANVGKFSSAVSGGGFTKEAWTSESGLSTVQSKLTGEQVDKVSEVDQKLQSALNIATDALDEPEISISSVKSGAILSLNASSLTRQATHEPFQLAHELFNKDLQMTIEEVSGLRGIVNQAQIILNLSPLAFFEVISRGQPYFIEFINNIDDARAITAVFGGNIDELNDMDFDKISNVALYIMSDGLTKWVEDKSSDKLSKFFNIIGKMEQKDSSKILERMINSQQNLAIANQAQMAIEKSNGDATKFKFLKNKEMSINELIGITRGLYIIEFGKGTTPVRPGSMEERVPFTQSIIFDFTDSGEIQYTTINSFMNEKNTYSSDFVPDSKTLNFEKFKVRFKEIEQARKNAKIKFAKNLSEAFIDGYVTVAVPEAKLAFEALKAAAKNNHNSGVNKLVPNESNGFKATNEGLASILKSTVDFAETTNDLDENERKTLFEFKNNIIDIGSWVFKYKGYTEFSDETYYQFNVTQKKLELDTQGVTGYIRKRAEENHEDYNKVIQKYKTILSEEYKTETYDVSKGEYIKKKYSPEVKKYILGDWKSNEEKTISFEKLNKEETLELQHAIKDLDRLYGEKTEGDYFYKYLNEKYD